MRVSEITTLEGLHAVIDEWRGLWLECPSATPFLSPEWLVPWWEWFGGGGMLRVATARKDERLVGLAPLFAYRSESNERSLAFIGTGVSDYLGVLFAPGFEAAFVAELFGQVIKAWDWDTCRLEGIMEGSPLLELPQGSGAEAFLQSTCPVIRLPDTADGFFRLLSNDFRRKVFKGNRDIEGAGAVKIEDADADAVPEFISELFALQSERWGASDRETARLKAFQTEAAKGISTLGCLALKRLRFNGKTASVLYSFKRGRRLYCYMTAFDERLAWYSPGRYLMAHAVLEAIGAGLKEFDFMRGSEPYKYAWGASDTFTYSLKIARPT